jgi:hypothetical protein
MFANEKWIEILPNAYYQYLGASTSDHSPILLSLLSRKPSFPKPFRYFNYWSNCEGYMDTVTRAWDFQVQGNPIYQVIMKLKNTKKCLKAWSNAGFSSPSSTIKTLRDELQHIQESLGKNPTDTCLQKEEAELKKNLELWIDLEECQLRQKSKELWLQLGDRNNRFFHSSLKNRYGRNSIANLVDHEGNAMTDITKLRTQAPQFYHQLYNQDSYWNVFPKLIVKRKISPGAAEWLIREVTDMEIKSTLFQLNPDKAPGPDGFNAKFFQLHWDIISQDISKAVRYFFKHKKFVRELNHTFLTLVSKSNNSSSLNDLRPIACCNLLYKIITKLLTNRLQMVINELVSLNHSVFLKGRQISDCSLLAHELVRDFHNPMGSRACMKIDLRKAFDSVNREFIYYMFHCLGFPYIWIEWIKECVSTSTFSVIIDGSPAGFSYTNRGIRQGDPLSPYLFVIVMEFWSICMDLAVAKGTIEPLKRGVPNQISHLLFADDMLVFCRANKKSFRELNKLFALLQLNTGLSINKEKTKVFFSKGCKRKAELASILGCTLGTMPVKYLGMPLSINYVKPKDFGWLFDKVRSKMEGWMFRALSFAGRVELAKSVLYSCLTYWLQSFRFPVSVIREIESMISNFIWKGKMHACSWETLCRPKNEGGIGLRKLADMSLAAGVKLLWRLGTSSCLWSKWMKEKYCAHARIWDIQYQLLHSGTFKFIINSKVSVADQISFDEDNNWIWEGNSAHKFNMHSAWEAIRTKHGLFQMADVLWHSYHCPKFSYCLYKALLNKLPTRDRLCRFGIIQDSVCVLCGEADETSQHIFFECQYTQYVWRLCRLKLGVKDQHIGSVWEEGLLIAQRFSYKNVVFILSRLVLAGAIWHIWQERNMRIFQNQELHKIDMFRRLYEDILVLMRTCLWKVGKESCNEDILSNWS